MSKLWFKAKTYGYGATPASWEGWAATVVYCALVTGGHLTALRLIHDPHRAAIAGWTAFAMLTAGFLWLITVKGERIWAWRWGKPD